MPSLTKVFAFFILSFIIPASALATPPVPPAPGHIIGNPLAPIRVDEYIALTCGHCGGFYNTTFPEIEEKYIKTGKVYFVVHDFPLSAFGLRAAAVANCLPNDEYIPYITALFNALLSGTSDIKDYEKKVYQYASLVGLSPEKAKQCANDPKVQDPIVADRSLAMKKYKIDATPTFVINEGYKTFNGNPGIQAFTSVFNQILMAPKSAQKKK